jgi:hypothetical protein
LQEEIPLLREYLKLPHVHLGIDPEYSMKTASVPGEKLGTMDAADINYASEYLAQLVVENNLPPKILVVHRFKTSMLTNYKQIEKRPEVQLVVHMDSIRMIPLTRRCPRSCSLMRFLSLILYLFIFNISEQLEARSEQ